MKLGEVLKNRLLNSRSHRLKRRLTKANEEMLAAIKESSERDLTSKRHRSCEDAARKMEDILFSVGDTKRVVNTLQYFKRQGSHGRANKSAECNGISGRECKSFKQRGKKSAQL